jgi:hypothetical protein
MKNRFIEFNGKLLEVRIEPDRSGFFVQVLDEGRSVTQFTVDSDTDESIKTKLAGSMGKSVSDNDFID